MWLLGWSPSRSARCTALAVLALPDPDPSDHAAIAAIAGVLALTALAQGLAGPANRLVYLTPFWGVLCVSALVVVARPLGAMPLFYLWPLLQAAYFLDRRPLIAIEATMLVTYAVALQFSPPGLRTAYFLAVVVCTAMVGGVVSHLKQRVDRLVTSLDAAASTDPLTGLLNRRAFEGEFEAELLRANRYGRPLTLAVFDLDHFKLVNDRFGHDVGDTALCRTAADAGPRAPRLRRRGAPGRRGVRGAVRGHGPGRGPPGGGPDRRRALAGPGRGLRPPVDQRRGCRAGPGLEDRVELMRSADAALYQAKAAGRHRVVSHDAQATVTGSDEPARTLAT